MALVCWVAIVVAAIYLVVVVNMIVMVSVVGRLLIAMSDISVVVLICVASMSVLSTDSLTSGV